MITVPPGKRGVKEALVAVLDVHVLDVHVLDVHVLGHIFDLVPCAGLPVGESMRPMQKAR
jgi:hypothetical protein